jgi:tripartite-type tricarboxylate transporter receptor subunit TctC
MDRRNFIAGCAGLSLVARAGDVLGQSGALTRIIFPFAAGGGGDTLCRVLGQRMGQLLDRTVIVEDRTGGDGLIGIRAVKGTKPDGATVLVTTGPTIYLLPMVEAEPSFNTEKDFVAVSLLARFEFAIVIGPSIEAKDFAQFAAWLKAHSDQATFGVPSNGTIPHFMGSRLEQVLKIPLTRVPYRGSAPIINDLVGGHLPFGIATLSDAIPQHRAGGVKIIAVSSAARSPFLPEVPTLKESGIDLVADAWYGMWLPGQFARSRQQARRCREQGAERPRGEGQAARDRAHSGRDKSGRTDTGTRGQHGVLAADRQGDGIQDHELRKLQIGALRDFLSDRGEFGFIPDADQDAGFDLELVLGIGGDLFVAGRDVIVGVQRPVEQDCPQSRDDLGA